MLIEDNWDVGVDIAEHDKFRRFTLQSYPHFYNKVFTLAEQQFCGTNIPRYAGIFAAKEAIFKAISNYGRVYISQFEIDHYSNGNPFVRDRKHELPDNCIMVENQCFNVKISISHTKDQSIAFAMARTREEET